MASYSASLLDIVIKHMREVVNRSRPDREDCGLHLVRKHSVIKHFYCIAMLEYTWFSYFIIEKSSYDKYVQIGHCSSLIIPLELYSTRCVLVPPCRQEMWYSPLTSRRYYSCHNTNNLRRLLPWQTPVPTLPSMVALSWRQPLVPQWRQSWHSGSRYIMINRFCLKRVGENRYAHYHVKMFWYLLVLIFTLRQMALYLVICKSHH